MTWRWVPPTQLFARFGVIQRVYCSETFLLNSSLRFDLVSQITIFLQLRICDYQLLFLQCCRLLIESDCINL